MHLFCLVDGHAIFFLLPSIQLGRIQLDGVAGFFFWHRHRVFNNKMMNRMRKVWRLGGGITT